MGMDFHNQQNRLTYTTREANKSWIETISKLISINDISKAADIGCGGGIYSKAMAEVGVTSVTGVDFSEAMLEGAKEHCEGYENISLRYGNALETGLDDNSYDLVLERALIHHIKDLQPCFEEAYRILQNDGIYIIQDRTPEDCLLEGDEKHIRGYFFELFPQLIEKETKRRFHSQFVINTLKAAGFKHIKEEKFWEVRKVYENKEQLFKDLSERTGRSILHELDDEELKSLIAHIDKSITTNQDLIEKDRWTIWKAVK
ncbi:SAM-dependent methyltransferase [Virgibacillus halodenitrificans]|uniref:SAM-dependent methyltransferase n=1 Tax=Virgibacillus halodenitrificans TaxID=1482 RepID=A0AAC9IZ14_VIRHA|nr:class I SAM-dependent methyltransferase [Virgibacillus halodenitrificans]APC47670.1 SAM-dependent methyltransferase [Virgibacillus halodenitrificans]